MTATIRRWPDPLAEEGRCLDHVLWEAPTVPGDAAVATVIRTPVEVWADPYWREQGYSVVNLDKITEGVQGGRALERASSNADIRLRSADGAWTIADADDWLRTHYLTEMHTPGMGSAIVGVVSDDWCLLYVHGWEMLRVEAALAPEISAETGTTQPPPAAPWLCSMVPAVMNDTLVKDHLAHPNQNGEAAERLSGSVIIRRFGLGHGSDRRQVTLHVTSERENSAWVDKVLAYHDRRREWLETWRDEISGVERYAKVPLHPDDAVTIAPEHVVPRLGAELTAMAREATRLERHAHAALRRHQIRQRDNPDGPAEDLIAWGACQLLAVGLGAHLDLSHEHATWLATALTGRPDPDVVIQARQTKETS